MKVLAIFLICLSFNCFAMSNSALFGDPDYQVDTEYFVNAKRHAFQLLKKGQCADLCAINPYHYEGEACPMWVKVCKSK